jgi:hypothetical protein
MKNDTTYNGWKNYQTWNVALWINNDEPIYRDLVAYAKRCHKRNHKPTYTGFMRFACLYGAYTGDGVGFANKKVCKKELTELLFDDLIAS